MLDEVYGEYDLGNHSALEAETAFKYCSQINQTYFHYAIMSQQAEFMLDAHHWRALGKATHVRARNWRDMQRERTIRSIEPFRDHFVLVRWCNAVCSTRGAQCVCMCECVACVLVCSTDN